MSIETLGDNRAKITGNNLQDSRVKPLFNQLEAAGRLFGDNMCPGVSSVAAAEQNTKLRSGGDIARNNGDHKTEASGDCAFSNQAMFGQTVNFISHDHMVEYANINQGQCIS